MTTVRTWEVGFYRKPEGQEIGPVLVTRDIRTTSKSKALEEGRFLARQLDWRLVAVREKTS